MVFVLNAILLLIAGFIVGWNFGVKTIFCVFVISVGMNFWQDVLPAGDFLHLERILAVILGGILAGVGAAVLVNIFAAFPIYIQPWSVFLSFAVCTLTGIFFGWYPAQKAAMLNPIDALRYE